MHPIIELDFFFYFQNLDVIADKSQACDII